MKQLANSSWVVLKFGGTSVSTAENWAKIASIVRARLAEGLQPLVVHSALSGISDRLQALLRAAAAGDAERIVEEVERRHRDLAVQLAVAVSDPLAGYFAELRQLAAGIALIGEASERVEARVMARGELMATELGVAYLRSQGLDCRPLDARSVLEAQPQLRSRERTRWLSASCAFDPDPALGQRLAALAGIVVTQGFIARNPRGETVLLGRGGSDTSAAYFAARLQARRLEIWTDVPGMFTANPRLVPSARLLKALDYQEAQEIASTGAKVLHPRCLRPVRLHGIPIQVFATPRPELDGTTISAQAAGGIDQVKAICRRTGQVLLSMETLGMWHQVGFLAEVFEIFKSHGLSVDLISTSETNLTVTLDASADQIDDETIELLVAALEPICRVRVIGPCTSVSLVGRNIRAILHRLGPALALFEQQKIYLVSQAANDLNFSFVVDEQQGDRLVQQLHDILIRKGEGDPVLGPTWEQLYAVERPQATAAAPWWAVRRDELLAALADREAAYVYDLRLVDRALDQLEGLRHVDRLLYAVKANPHPAILQRIERRGLGFECVSLGELEHVRAVLPGIEHERILFTPNFAPREEYARALALGVRVTLDNLYPLRAWPELLAGQQVFVRLDPGSGEGHHRHVRTAGEHSKFGVPLFELDELAHLADRHALRIVGLHAHRGSGILAASRWRETASVLAEAAQRFADVRVLDLGGGLGVPEKAGQAPLDLAALDEAIGAVHAACPQYRLWLEPGRFVVARAGVLLARVTQLKGKGEIRYVGIATGMNSLIRPALYGAWHEIANLSRLGETPSELFNIVGPICEGADQLGSERLLPPCCEGDVLLIANTGAYGHAMSSRYNLREPAEELVIE